MPNSMSSLMMSRTRSSPRPNPMYGPVPTYEATAPRPYEDAVDDLLRPDADYTLDLLLDAIRVLPRFGDPDRDNFGEFHPETPVEGEYDVWTYSDTLRVIDDAFGPEGYDNVKHIHSYLPDPEEALDAAYCTRLAVLLRAGWAQGDGYLWWTHLSGANTLLLEVTSDWVAAWGLDSLNACVRAGLGLTALADILDAEVLPPPASIAMLAALRPSKG